MVVVSSLTSEGPISNAKNIKAVCLVLRQDLNIGIVPVLHH